MHNFIFRNPTKIFFGRGVLKNLGSELKSYGKSTLIIYGSKNIIKIGLLDKVKKILINNNISYFELSGIIPNPVISKVRMGINIVKKNRIKTILAIGGGSVIDTGKIISAGATVNHDPWDFFTGKKTVQKGIPLITIQTLSGTAAEVTSGATITNNKTKEKLGAGGYSLYPKASFLDPEITFSVPSNHTAYGAADMLSHILDPYFFGRNDKTSVPDKLAEAIAKIIFDVAIKTLLYPKNYETRATLMWTAVLANNGMISRGSNPSRYYFHMLEHSISGLFNVPHGAGLSVIIIGWTKYAAKHMPFKLAQFGINVFNIKRKKNENIHMVAKLTASMLKKWFKTIKCPTKLSELNIKKNKFNIISESILKEIKKETKGLEGDKLKDFTEQYYPEKKNLLNINSVLKFEKQRIIKILKLCE